MRCGYEVPTAIASVGNTFGTPVVEQLSVLLAYFLHTHECTNTHTYAYTPWIHKFVTPKIVCGISQDTKHTEKCSNNKTKTTQKQNHETTDKYFSKILQR
jgi:hypothetical protein